MKYCKMVITKTLTFIQVTVGLRFQVKRKESLFVDTRIECHPPTHTRRRMEAQI